MDETLLDSLRFPPPPPFPSSSSSSSSSCLVPSSEDWLTEASNDASLGWLLGGISLLEDLQLLPPDLPPDQQNQDAKKQEDQQQLQQLQMGFTGDCSGIDTQWLLDFLLKPEEEAEEADAASVVAHVSSESARNSNTSTAAAAASQGALTATPALESCLLLHLHDDDDDDGQYNKCKRQRRSWDWNPAEYGLHNTILTSFSSSSSSSSSSPSAASSSSPSYSSSCPIIVPPGRRTGAWAGPTLSDVQSALAMRESSHLSPPITAPFPSNIYLKSSSKETRHMVKVTSTSNGVLDDGYRWRKYGQKLIKSSPYPRNYYKCTYSGCRAKKQTERCKADPNNAIWVCYEGIHLHLRPNPVTSLRPQQP